MPPESVLDDDDYLAEQQLKQDMARGRPRKQVPQPTTPQDEGDVLEFINESAFKGIKKVPATATGAEKRKRGESAEENIEEKPRKRRVAEREDRVTESQGAEKDIPRKLPRPSRATRHMIQTYPAVKEKNSDIFEYVGDTSRQDGVGESAKRTKNLHSTTEAAVLAEGHSSAILNGRANATEKSGRGKSKTETASKSSGIKTNAPRKEDATLEGTDADGKQLNHGPEELQDDVDMTESLQLQTEDDDESGRHSLDLLGLEMDWEKILKAAQSVGGSKLPKNQMPKFQTETIKALVSEVREARSLYQNRPCDKPIDDFHELLISIEDQIKHDGISEAKAFNKKSQMIRDIYTRAIPALVFLLESAFSFHALHPKGLHRYEALQDIVRVQEMIICLSMKAKIWKARPNTDKPIIKPTKGIILPYTRGMKKVFQEELIEQKRRWKMSQNASNTARSKEGLTESFQKQREVSSTEADKRVARGLPHIQREREIFRSSRKPIGSLGLQFSQENNGPHHSTHWNAEEEKELMKQLQSGYASDQSGRCFDHSSISTLF